jgi:response regulator of citrate/malate metabolism
MFGLYEAYCDKAQNAELERRRYNVVWDLYMAEQPMTTKEVANKMNISKETVYLDQNIALERLTALIFGVDGLYAK